MSNEYQAGFNAYVDDAAIPNHPVSDDFRRGYKDAFDDHMKMEASILAESEAQSTAHFATDDCVDLAAAPHLRVNLDSDEHDSERNAPELYR